MREEEWTSGVVLAHERLATLSGASRGNIVTSVPKLERLRHIRIEKVRHPRDRRMVLTKFHVASALFAQRGESYVSFDGTFLYGHGEDSRLPWASFPGFGYRHAWLTRLLVEAPVYNVERWKDSLALGGLDRDDLLRRRMWDREFTASDLHHFSGISRDRCNDIVSDIRAPSLTQL